MPYKLASLSFRQFLKHRMKISILTSLNILNRPCAKLESTEYFELRNAIGTTFLFPLGVTNTAEDHVTIGEKISLEVFNYTLNSSL